MFHYDLEQTWVSALTTARSLVLEALARAVIEEKEIKRYKLKRRKSKLFLFANDMILYGETKILN